MKITENETTLTVHTDTRAVAVTRYDEIPVDLFLTVRDPDGPRDQEAGSIHLTPQAAEAVAHALLGVDSHHDLDAYAARVFAKHRRDCHDGATDGDCAACSIAVGAGSAFTLSDLADLRARWANETQPYHPGGKLPRAEHYRLDRDGTMHRNPEYTGWHVTTGGKTPSWADPYVRVLEQAAEINDLKAERDDALARERQAVADRDADINDLRAALNDALARLTRAQQERENWRITAINRAAADPVYAVTEEEVDDVWVTVHTTLTAHEALREYRTDRRTVVPGETPERLRESIGFHLQSVADLEAIARAMEEG